MVRRVLIERKLQALSGYLDELEAAVPGDFESYLADRLRRRAAERLLQLVVEVAIDVNTHVAAEKGAVPEDNYHSFLSAGQEGLIEPGLAARLAPSSGLRNRLVHEYDAVDDRMVHAAIHAALEDYRLYLRQVMEYLDRG
jgi:uncharacterized protein YutE (UPF0331/DUF86 family)